MPGLDALQEIFATLQRNKLRTALTALSVAWGMLMLVVLLGAGRGLENGAAYEFRDDAVNSLWLYVGKTTLPFAGRGPGREVKLTNDDYEAIQRSVPGVEHITGDTPHTDDPALWQKRLHGSADPGRPVNVHVRVDGWPGQQFALLFRDWLTANPEVQSEYVAVKRKAQETPNYAEAKEPWFVGAYRRAWDWGTSVNWRP